MCAILSRKSVFRRYCCCSAFTVLLCDSDDFGGRSSHIDHVRVSKTNLSSGLVIVLGFNWLAFALSIQGWTDIGYDAVADIDVGHDQRKDRSLEGKETVTIVTHLNSASRKYLQNYVNNTVKTYIWRCPLFQRTAPKCICTNSAQQKR